MLRKILILIPIIYLLTGAYNGRGWGYHNNRNENNVYIFDVK